MLVSQGMSQHTNIAIPARFDFKPYKESWDLSRAKIVGWWEEPEPGPLYRTIVGRSPVGSRSGDRVLVNVNIPSAKMKPADFLGLPGMSGLGGMCDLSPTYTVEINPADIPAEVLQPHENIRNAPDIAGREFDVLACPIESPYRKKPEGPTKDAWKMQSEYFDMKEDICELQSFLNRWGRWNFEIGYLGPLPLTFTLIIPHLFWKQREKYRDAKTGKPRSWLCHAGYQSFSSINGFTSINEPPFIVMARSYCEQAIQATITIDHLSNVQFGICKRDDCRKLFKRITKQKRLYCCHECAHLANIRKIRADEKKAPSKQRGEQRNAKG